MPKKPTAETTVTVTVTRASLRAARETLTAEEERALRMRHGAGVVLDEPLERKGQSHPDARARLAELELMAFTAAGNVYGLGQAPATAQPSRAKDKIIRALRRK